ncbi:hypothetical protein TRVA0_034S00144 [Trichomonascus vanleenenianus]|uniref:uncharacterized protein n=1 Tax=Trichomonascus vanleenenianus TaxID=2268995 RepID=UPI003EC9F6AB
MLRPGALLRLGHDDTTSLARHGVVELHLEVTNIAAEGWKALERVSSKIALMAFDRFRHRYVLSHLVQFVQNSVREFQIIINSFELHGETTIHLPRGNLSLSIEAISSESKIVLECEEKLAYLSITKKLTERLVGPELDIHELRVTGKPNSAALRRIVARFANVRTITTDN